MRSTGPIVVFALALFAATVPARAQSADSSSVDEATRLFEQAKALYDGGEHQRACDLFQKSFDLVRGIGVQYNLARCYATIGRTASALRHYSEVADVADRTQQAERAQVARQRMAELEPRLTRLRIVVSERAQDLVVSLDGAPLDESVLGSAQPVDPGTHSVAAVAPERQAWSTEVDVEVSGQTVDVVVPRLESAVAATPTADPPETSFWSGQAIAGVVVGGIGVVGMGVGVGVALAAKQRDDDAAAHCDDRGCEQQGLDLNADALTMGDVATGMFIGGGVLAATGVVLIVTSVLGGPDATVPDEESATAWTLTPWFSDRGGAVSLGASF